MLLCQLNLYRNTIILQDNKKHIYLQYIGTALKISILKNNANDNSENPRGRRCRSTLDGGIVLQRAARRGQARRGRPGRNVAATVT